MHPLLAAIPLFFAVVLILLLRQNALRAGFGLLVTALLIGLFDKASALNFQLILHALWRTFAITLPIAYILLGGVFLYWVLRAGDALEAIARMTVNVAPDPGLRILLLTYGLGVFFESATGFGVGIIVTAPLFLSLGYSPLRAGLLALLGQCAVPWGALAVGTTLGARLADLPLGEASLYALLISIPSILICGAVALIVAQVKQSVWLSIGQLFLLAAVLTLGIALASWAGAAELAGCIGGLSVIALVLLGRYTDSCQKTSQACTHMACFVPLAVLVISLALTRFVPFLSEGLRSVAWHSTDGMLTIAPLHHPGFWLLMSAVTGILIWRLPLSRVRHISQQALKQWAKAVLAVAGFIASGQVMALAGMTDALTHAAVQVPQWSLPLLMPAVGALGGFLTASNAGSNAIFMEFQMQLTAFAQLDLNYTAAAQNSAASIACMMSPGRLALAQLLIGRDLAEYQLLRAVAPITLLCVLSIMIFLLLLLS